MPDEERVEPAVGSQSPLLALALDAAEAVVWDWDLDTGHVSWAGNVATVLGAASPDLGDSFDAWLAAVHPDDRPVLTGWLDALRAGKSDLRPEFRLVTPDGGVKWLAGQARTYGDVAHPARVVGVIADVTQRRQVEEELRERERTLSAVVAATPDLITCFDRDLQVVWASPANEAVLGYRPDQRVGRGSLELLHPEDHDLFVVPMRQVLAGEQPAMAARYRVRHADGRWVVIDARGRPLRDDRGGIVGVVVVSRDATEQAELQAALQEAKAEAERANRATTDFLSRMSHELRTPLNAVLGFAQVLELDDLGSDQRDSVGQILRGGRHLLNLINEILDISRIESGRLPLSLEPVRVAEVLAEAVELIRPLAARWAVTLATLPEAESDIHVGADRQRLKQVVLNLLANAVKYNRVGGEVRPSFARVGDGEVRISVTDEGPGIPEAQRPLLFEPFERLGAEQSTVEGTGLGLALAKGLVEAMGGVIGVDTAEGQGSTFWVELAAVDPLIVSVEPAPSAAHATPVTGGGACTVLYVEDNLSSLRLVEQVLARRPEVRLLTAMQGSVGLELARAHRPDLVLLDVNLPDLPGDVLLHRLRADPATQAIPVVMVSADATPGQIRRLLASGAADYLTKPFDLARFLAVIDTIGSSPSTAAPPEGAVATTGEAVDLAFLRTVLGLDEGHPAEGVTEVLGVFLGDTEARLAELRENIARADVEAVERVAHSLTGSTANFGAGRLSGLCGELQQAAASGDQGAMATALAAIEAEFEQVRAVLDREFTHEA